MFATKQLLFAALAALTISTSEVLGKAKEVVSKTTASQVGSGVGNGRIKVGNKYMQARAMLSQGPVTEMAVGAYFIDAALYGADAATTFMLTADGKLTTASKETKKTEPINVGPGDVLVAKIYSDSEAELPQVWLVSERQLKAGAYPTTQWEDLTCKVAAANAFTCSSGKTPFKFVVCPGLYHPDTFALLAPGGPTDCKEFQAITWEAI